MANKDQKETVVPEYPKNYQPKPIENCKHEWDKYGERCLKCGDKDWM